MARLKKAAEEAPATTTQPNAAAQAFAETEAEITALAADEVLPLQSEISAVVSFVSPLIPRLYGYRNLISEHLPHHPIAQLDNLQRYALAVNYADLVHSYASDSPGAVEQLLAEAAHLRDGLLIGAEALAHRGLFEKSLVEKIRQKPGDIGQDLVELAGQFVSEWPKISNKTAVERHEVDRAVKLGFAVPVLQSVGKKGGKPLETEDQRARAYTLLVRAYESCRRALTYLRWNEGDADAIAPPLPKKRQPRAPGKKSADGEAEPEASELG